MPLAHLYLAQSAATANEFFAELTRADETSGHASRGEQLWIKAFKAASFADPATAQKLFQELVSAFPDDERAQTLLGITYFGQQDYAQAVATDARFDKTTTDWDFVVVSRELDSYASGRANQKLCRQLRGSR